MTRDEMQKVRDALNWALDEVDYYPMKKDMSEALAILDAALAAPDVTATHTEWASPSSVSINAAPQDDAHADDLAVDRFAAAMKAKLAKQRAKGYAGWNDPAACSTAMLQDSLASHVAKGDPVDVGNFAMMLFCRGERTAAPQDQDAKMDEIRKTLKIGMNIGKALREGINEDIAKDAARYRWLVQHDTGDEIFEYITLAVNPQDWSEAIDAAMQQEQKP